MKSMKRIFLYILAFAITVLAGCDKPTKEQKQADALFQKITKIYTLNPDGSIDYQYQHELDLHSHLSFNRLYGETFIIYNPDHQEIKINRSETETAGGKMVPSPDNAFNEVLPQFAEGAPPYHQLREMVVTHTGLEQNSTIHLDYNIHTDAGYKPFLMENTVLAEASPVRELVIKVRFPKDKELNYQLFNALENLNISNRGDMKEYQWVFKDLEAAPKDDHQPRYGEHLPRLTFSTTDFEQAMNHLMDQFSYDLPSSVESGIQAILKNKTNRMDSILAIQDMVVNHINHFDVPLEHKGFSMHTNEQVLENNGGTTFEKTVLLASILKKSGFQAHPVTIIPDPFYSEKIGNLHSLEEYFVQVDDEEEKVYLSAIQEDAFNHVYNHAGENNVLLNDETGEVRVLDLEKPVSKQHLSGNFSIRPSLNIQGEVKATMTHCENPYLQMERNEEAAQSVLSPGFPAASVSGHAIEQMKPGETRLSYTISHRLSPDQQNGYRFVTIPETQTGIDRWHLDALTAERETPDRKSVV